MGRPPAYACIAAAACAAGPRLASGRDGEVVSTLAAPGAPAAPAAPAASWSSGCELAPAAVCLRRDMKSSSVEPEELEVGKRPRVPPSTSALRDLCSEDEASPGAPPLPSAGWLGSAACVLEPGDAGAGAEPRPRWPTPSVSAAADGCAGGGATASTRAMVPTTVLCHGVGGRAGFGSRAHASRAQRTTP
jgi:hypothetical protein